MRDRYAVLFALAPLFSVAQPQLPSFTPQDTVRIPCPQDTTRMILTYEGWEAYQTLNDTWDGPRDSTVCVDLAYVVNQWISPRIQLDQIDGDRPVFLRVKYSDDTVLPLAPDNLYSIGLDLYGLGLFDTGTCPGGPCTGALAAVRIPDASGDSTDLRWYNTTYDTEGTSAFSIYLCVPTERFAMNDLREFIVSMKFAAPTAGSYMSWYFTDVQDADLWWGLERITPTTLANHVSGQFNYQFGFDGQDHLVMYPDTTYPSPAHVGYLDVPPTPNVASPTEVTVNLQPYTGFTFQPYTQIRGALVLGSDSIRHPLTVVNNGADLCMGWEIAEIVWGPGDRYVHHSGHIDLKGVRSCFLFHPESTLEVPGGSRLYYGAHGGGMLALMNRSNLMIGNGGELVVQGTLVIKEAPSAVEHEDMYITLGEGARLTFAPGSRLHNGNSIEGRMQLVVTLDGGTIDISGLGPEDRMKVRIVELPSEPLTTMRMLGNPVGDHPMLEFESRSDGLMMIRCMDALGRTVAQRTVAVVQGPNRIALPFIGLPTGSYFLEARLGEEQQVLRFVKE